MIDLKFRWIRRNYRRYYPLGRERCMHESCNRKFRKTRDLQWFCSETCRERHIDQRIEDNPMLAMIKVFRPIKVR